MVQTTNNLNTYIGNIPNTSIKTPSRQEMKNQYGKFNLFISTSHYNDNAYMNIQNFLYITAYVGKDEDENIKKAIFDFYKKIQYPILKNKHLFEHKVSAIAYPICDASRWSSIGKPPYSPSHFHMIVAARTPEERDAVINILIKEKNNLGSLHYQHCINKASSLYTLIDHSLKAFAKTGFGANPNYKPIFLPLKNRSSKKNNQAKLANIGRTRSSRHGYIPNQFILGPGV